MQWAKSWRVNPAYAARPSSETDIAVIELAEPFAGNPGFFPIFSPNTQDLERLRGSVLAHISGYPGDKPRGTQWEHSERIDRITPQQLFYSVDTCPGHSGAPVWIHRTRGGPAEVIAVHTAGPTPHGSGAWGCRPGVPFAPAGQFNRGVRLNPALRAAVLAGFRP